MLGCLNNVCLVAIVINIGMTAVIVKGKYTGFIKSCSILAVTLSPESSSIRHLRLCWAKLLQNANFLVIAVHKQNEMMLEAVKVANIFHRTIRRLDGAGGGFSVLMFMHFSCFWILIRFAISAIRWITIPIQARRGKYKLVKRFHIYHL